MGEPLRTTSTPDGRTLAFAVWGDPDGFPVLFLHGTPGCRLDRFPDEDLYRELGVCYVTHDRAGYGQSSRRRGRRVADEAEDVLLLADVLGFECFGVVGASGGGPHALACAARLPGRVVRAISMVGVAPLGPAGLERDAWLAGMDPENVLEVESAEAGEAVLVRRLEQSQKATERRVAEDPATRFGNFQLSDSDRKQLAAPELAQVKRESIFELAAHGVWGWVDDDLALLADWGFEVSEIEIPVLVRYGRTDVFVPPAHGDWLAANVPGCTVKADVTAGHLGTDRTRNLAENVHWLRDGVPPAGSTYAGAG